MELTHVIIFTLTYIDFDFSIFLIHNIVMKTIQIRLIKCILVLFKASENGHKDVVSHLIASGADGRIHPVTKYSPLYIG